MIFLIFSIVVFNLVACFIPKRLTKLEIYSSSLFALLLAVITDKFLDIKYDLYGYFGVGLEWQTVVVAVGIYPSANVIFLNYYPCYGSVSEKARYILGWSLFAVAFEWASVKAGYFYYHDWTLWYSIVCYPPIYYILALNLKFIRKLKAADTGHASLR